MLDADVLVLNRVYLPVRVTSVRRAVSLLYQGRARAILPDYSTYDFPGWSSLHHDGESLGLTTTRLRVPRVIVLGHYDGVPRYEVRFTRRNVYRRDGFQCQYCGISPGAEALNLDHVRPLSKGGTSCWENVVTCCVRCNRRKADRTPKAAGMTLRKAPRRPRWHPLHEARARRPWPEDWSHFVDRSILEWRPAPPRAVGSPSP